MWLGVSFTELILCVQYVSVCVFMFLKHMCCRLRLNSPQSGTGGAGWGARLG